jgi:hypothetical protein
MRPVRHKHLLQGAEPDKRKNGIANKFQFFKNPNDGNVVERNSKYVQFFFLKIVKIEPANKVQTYFLERNAFSAHKTSLFISFTSLIGME